MGVWGQPGTMLGPSKVITRAADHPSFVHRGPAFQPRARHGDPINAHQSSTESDATRGSSHLWHRIGTAAAAAAFALHAATALPALALDPAPSPTPIMTSPDVLDRLPPLPTQFPPLPPLKLPKYERLTLPNGLRVILLEDHEAPLVRGTVLLRGGQRASPPDRVGLASIAAAVQRAGGSRAHPGQAFDEVLEDLSAAIEGGAASEFVSLGFSCLAEDAPRVLGLFAEVLTDPALPPDKVEFFKAQVLNALAHRNDNPSGIPAREAAKLVYGKDSVYVREPTLEQVSAISADDVAQWLATWERPDAAVLGVVGDFKAKDMAGIVQKTLGGWRPGVAGPPPALPASPVPDQAPLQGRVFLVDRPGASQTSVAAAELGVSMMDADECALDVLGDLLNSFGGRLFDGIRSREGLAYSVSGGWVSAPPDHPGLFLASAETAKPAELLVALRSALEVAATSAPGAEELARAKEESLNSFVFSFSSTPAQLRRAVTFELLGIPNDYVFRYQARLAKVTGTEVEAAAARHLHPIEGQVTVVVGDAKTLAPELERTLGRPVELIRLE